VDSKLLRAGMSALFQVAGSVVTANPVMLLLVGSPLCSNSWHAFVDLALALVLCWLCCAAPCFASLDLLGRLLYLDCLLACLLAQSLDLPFCSWHMLGWCCLQTPGTARDQAAADAMGVIPSHCAAMLPRVR
jgi:hypothetical protein